MLELTCSFCAQKIPPEDQDTIMGTACCRVCGTVHRLTYLQKQKLNNAWNPRGFDKFVLAHVSRNNPDQILLSPKRGKAVFMLPVAIPWLFFLVAMSYLAPALVEKPPLLAGLLFGIPFLLGSIALWVVILYVLIGRVALTVDQEQGVFTYQILLGPLTIYRRRLAISSGSIVYVEPGNTIMSNARVPYRLFWRRLRASHAKIAIMRNARGPYRLRVASKSGSLAFGSLTLQNHNLSIIRQWLQGKLCGKNSQGNNKPENIP